MPRVAEYEHVRDQVLSGGWCEYCGKPGYTEKHHIKTRGSGGRDMVQNLIRLCVECHEAAHLHNIDRLELVQIVAEREQITPENVCLTIGIPVPDSFPAVRERKEPPTLEELIQAIINLDEYMDECNFLKGQLLSAMAEVGVKSSWIASQIKSSAAQVRELIKTYRAFPVESMRVPVLSWYHHRVAANSNDPARWINKAADEEWSTRELATAIKEEERPETSETEIERAQQKAEKLWEQIQAALSKDGPAADWLREQLRRALG